MRKSIYFFFFFSIFLLAITPSTSTLLAEDDSQHETDSKRFAMALADSLQHLDVLQTKPVFRLRAMNDSVRKTAAAIEVLAKESDNRKAEELLRGALKDFKQNPLAELVLGDIFEREGRYDESNERYVAFLKKASALSSFNREILPPENRAILIDHIRKKLIEHGMAPKELDQMGRMPLLERMKTEEGSILLQAISIGLPITILVFTFFIILTYVTNQGEASESPRFGLALKIYAVLVLSYVLWLLRLLLRLPPILGPAEYEILMVIAAGLVAVFVSQVADAYFSKKDEELDPAFMPCPNCKKPIPKLSATCPCCRKEL